MPDEQVLIAVEQLQFDCGIELHKALADVRGISGASVLR